MNRTTKAISAITLFLLISKFLVFIREMIIAAYYGATYQTDAYNMAIRIIDLSNIFIASGIAQIIIPMYNYKKAAKGKEEADIFANSILWVLSLFCAILAITGMIFAPILVKILAPSFNSEIAMLTVNIIRMMFLFNIVINISNFLIAMAKINSKFAITVIVSYPASILAIIFAVFLAKYIGIYALTVSYILFTLIQMPILIVSLRKVFKLKVSINFINSDIKNFIKLSVPIYIGIFVWEISVIIERMLASGLPEGSISAISYADKLRFLPDGIITASILMVIFPLLSKYAAEKNIITLKSTVQKTISLLFIALLPISAVCLYYSKEITKIVYERGAFTSNDTKLTAYIFIFGIISLVFIGSLSLLNNAFYSMQDTKTPLISGCIAAVCKIILYFIFIRYMQAAGLALAYSIAIFINFILLFIQFRRKFGAFGGLSFLKNIIKCVISTASMIPVFFLGEFLRDRLPLIIFFGIGVIVSLLVYAILLYLLKMDLFMDALKQAKNFLKKRKKNSP